MKTTKGLFKKLTSLLIAGTMLLSILPMTSVVATEVPDGKVWQTLVNIQMDAFEALRTEWTTKDSATINGRDIGAELVWGSGAFHANSRAHKYGQYDYWTEVVYNSRPSTVGEYGLVHHGAWVSGSGWTKSDQGWKFKNLWDANTVSVGDKVRITAQVYPSAKNMSTQNSKQEPTADASGNIIPVENGNMRMTAGGVEDLTNVTGDQWNEMVMDIDITEANISTNNAVQIDSGAVGEGNFYAVRWLLGSVTVEILEDANGSYTIDTGKKWETVSEIDFDGFADLTYSDWNMETTETVDGHTYGLGFTNGVYHSATGLKTRSEVDSSISFPSIVKDKTNGKIALVRRKWVDVSTGWTSPKSGFWVKNIFGPDGVQLGDRVKITAYVYHNTPWKYDGKNLAEYPDGEATNTASTVMWLSQADDASTTDINENFFSNNPLGMNNGAGEINIATTKANEWNEISLEYVIGEGNQYAEGVQICSLGVKEGDEGKVVLADAPYAMPYMFYLAGLKVEKQVDTGSGTVDAAVGTVNIDTEGIATEGSKILVAAYDGDMFLGCDILDCEAEKYNYDFVIYNAKAADSVKAYVWNMNDIEPQFTPIELTAK